MLQPTASRTALLLQCGRPFSEGIATENVSGEAAEYGTAFHLAMQNEKINAQSAAQYAHIKEHVKASLQCLKDELRDWNATLAERETSKAMKVGPGKAWVVQRATLELETHHYDMPAGYIGGTVDAVAVADPYKRIVVDYKTGQAEDYSRPSQNLQMLTLASMWEADAVAILHTPPDSIPVMYIEDVDKKTLEKHRKRLRLAMARVNDGSMRPGPECDRCPARAGCPAADADLIGSTSALVTSVVPTLAEPGWDLGRMHLLLGELDRLAKRAKDQIRERVEAGEEIVRPDGKTLRIIEKEYERLSKSSILEALGKERGEAMIAELRKLGCLTTETRPEMWAK